MEAVLIRIRILFCILILLLVFSCSHNRPNAQLPPNEEPNCAKFASDYTPTKDIIATMGDRLGFQALIEGFAFGTKAIGLLPRSFEVLL